MKRLEKEPALRASFFTSDLYRLRTHVYKAMEGVGYEADILVDRVEEARDAQDAASERFASALEHSAPVNFDGGTSKKP
jgi:hypothetical protein